MGQFKPMVKMMTTEPSIELKLKKGGHVAMPKMKSKDESGHKKMAMGGMPPAMDRAGLPPGPVGGAAPAAPSMAARRKAMMGRKKADGGEALKKHAAMPASKAHKGLKTGGVAMGQGGYKDGGSVIPVSASKKGAEGYAETKMVTTTPDRSPAKTGGVKMGNAGGYKKGGNVKKMALGGMTGYLQGVKDKITAPKPGSGGGGKPPVRIGYGPNDAPPGVIDRFKDQVKNQIKNPTRGSGPNDAGPGRPFIGPRRPLPQAINKPTNRLPFGGPKYDENMPGGPNNPIKVKSGGSAKKYAKGGGVEGNVSSTPAGVTNTTTGGVRKGNAGGYKKGGAPKKFARGGSVNDSGKAVKMPQKSPPTPVSINRLSGTYKKGGKVKKYAEGGDAISESQAKARERFDAEEAAENKAEREAFIDAMKSPLETMKQLPSRLKRGYDALKEGLKGSGSVTTTEREVSRTVTPTKKRYGGAC